MEENPSDKMPAKPMVSLIMATFNRAHLLPRAIKSALNQTYTNFELIIIDDDSPDNTKEVIESFKDQRIIYHNRTKSDRNIGSGFISARNCGFDMARGEIIAKLDDDDELLPYALETAIREFKRLSQKSVKIIWFESIDAESGKPAGKHFGTEFYVTYKDLLCEVINGDYWVVVCKNALKEHRLDERLWTGQGFLWLLIHRNHKGYYIPKILYKQYRGHGARMSNSSLFNHLSRAIFTQEYYLKEFGDDLKKLCPKKYVNTLGSLGINQILNDQMNSGRENLRKSLKYGFSVKYLTFYLLQLILPKKYLINLCKLASDILSY